MRWKHIGCGVANFLETDVWIFICSENRKVVFVMGNAYISKGLKWNFIDLMADSEERLI